ncbi:hypothetical protein [Pseudohongiella spirulinae]|uniref:hypothetical protein n=1 Tax=Pseudohongiella spirulinae TaxID=1249552 RepID=UPI000717789A|nr:hypothetical protein [Pseudohongiella spirulinae]
MSRLASVRRLATFGIALVVAVSPVSAIYGQTLSEKLEQGFVQGVGWSIAEADEIFRQALDADSATLMERAVQAYRAAEGPYGLSQLPAIQHLLQHRLKQQDWPQLRRDLSTAMGIYTAHYEPDHPIFIKVSQVRAHWHLLAYFNGGEINRSTDLSAVLPELEAAYRLTTQAIELASDHYGQAYPDLPEMLRDMAAMSWLFAHHHRAGDTRAGRIQTSHSGSHRLAANDPAHDRHGYRQGRQALQGVIDLYLTDEQIEQATLAQAWLDLSGWHQQFGYQRRAEDAYMQAQKSADALDEEQRDRLFRNKASLDPLSWLNTGLATSLVFPNGRF